MLFYPGFEVLPPLVIYRTSKTDDEKYAAYCQQLAHRLDTLWQAEPLPFRQQRGGLCDSRVDVARGYCAW
jgi:NAD(P)H dehydrogenase (quinone)